MNLFINTHDRINVNWVVKIFWHEASAADQALVLIVFFSEEWKAGGLGRDGVGRSHSLTAVPETSILFTYENSDA